MTSVVAHFDPFRKFKSDTDAKLISFFYLSISIFSENEEIKLSRYTSNISTLFNVSQKN